MANQKITSAPGNRVSLRSRPQNQVHQIPFLVNLMGPLADVLTTTWGGILMGIATLAAGGFILFNYITANGMHTAIPDIPAMILLIIGVVLIAVNVASTNPSFGSQFLVSLQFVRNEYRNHQQKGTHQQLRPFKFVDPDQRILETPTKNGKFRYLIAYQVRGVISPTSFSAELHYFEDLDKQLLSSLERDTLLVTVNSVQAAHIKPKPLPDNQTMSMIQRRNAINIVANNLPYNQQLKTLMIINAPNLQVLETRNNYLLNVFNNGLVIGYSPLSGRALQQAIRENYT